MKVESLYNMSGEREDHCLGIEKSIAQVMMVSKSSLKTKILRSGLSPQQFFSMKNHKNFENKVYNDHESSKIGV